MRRHQLRLAAVIWFYNIIIMLTSDRGMVYCRIMNCELTSLTERPDSHHSWKHYIAFLWKQNQKNCQLKRHNVLSLLTCQTHLIPYINATYKFASHLNAPYSHIDYKGKLATRNFIKYKHSPTVVQWTVTVHSTFMVNITIIKSYTNFSESCEAANVQVYEGHKYHRNWVIETFCGHIMYESVYTQHNKALLIVKTSPEVSSYHAVLKATYGILDKKSAFRYKLNTPCMLPGLHSNVQPALLMRASNSIQHVWYISNTALRGKGANKDATFLAIVSVRIWTCLSMNRTAKISIYPGILSYYWARWKVPPHTAVHCKLQQLKDVIVDFHMYATVLLTYSSTDIITSVNVSFYNTYGKEVKSVAAESEATFTHLVP